MAGARSPLLDRRCSIAAARWPLLDGPRSMAGARWPALARRARPTGP
jgi:hypothetical protein